MFVRFLPVLFMILSSASMADVEADREAFRAFYAKRFSSIPVEAHVDGVYALDEAKRAQWLEMEEFPPYEFSVDDGEALYDEPFTDGSGYGDCFADGGAVKHLYPRFEGGEVVTMEVAVNQCRVQHGMESLAYDSEEMMQLTSYIAYASRDQLIDIKVPEDALPAYERGKQFYYSRRGQLNFSCSHCHMQIVGSQLRAEVLSASYGHVTHWPTYRLKWQEVGSLHRRFAECNGQVGAEALPLQSQPYRELEYFLTAIARGLLLNGPASRK
ncbi:MAG: sulfur oxidation c-type cytochrome SoxA [Gammaproteobacteria bacterium]|jgi:L-cysteine S-thiosulfotransferase|nr:sulfur oxidation c-type cytochrome SoxA [Gammaproteobacteria bacterium]MBT4494919.1 sulfur oxidation c-type cytochrome SoxA [Gammaproteobacteria bacterium]MBT7369995.1 sulfur oxidation c-type cytochrome SoxA [Gammaproteobacteria bacterium]